MKTIQDAVVDFGGKWPETADSLSFYPDGKGCYSPYWVYFGDALSGQHICTRAEFEAEAKRMGFVNGYRWGVEYPTDGKKPELRDDVLVNCYGFDEYKYGEDVVSERQWDLMGKFIVTDERYKPADTSYLDAVSEATRTKPKQCWYDYDKQVAVALPPVGALVNFEWGGCNRGVVEVVAYRNHQNTIVMWNVERDAPDAADVMSSSFRPLDWNRKQDQERLEFVEAASKVLNVPEINSSVDVPFALRLAIDALFDAGCRFTENKAP